MVEEATENSTILNIERLKADEPLALHLSKMKQFHTAKDKRIKQMLKVTVLEVMKKITDQQIWAAPVKDVRTLL